MLPSCLINAPVNLEVLDLLLIRILRVILRVPFSFIFYFDIAVDIVLAQSSHNIDGRTVDVKRAVPRDRAPAPTAGRHESRKIFVGGLAPEVNEKEFNEYFSKFGTLQVSFSYSLLYFLKFYRTQ
jgi:hypothetical protein